MTLSATPYVIQLQAFSQADGKLGFIESPDIPFAIKRLYWLYDLPENAVRGNHAHLLTDRLMVCLSGHITVSLTGKDGAEQIYELRRPDHALYYPRNFWMKLTVRSPAIVIVGASDRFSDDQVIGNLNEFLDNRV